jgi:hypothetical protein
MDGQRDGEYKIYYSVKFDFFVVLGFCISSINLVNSLYPSSHPAKLESPLICPNLPALIVFNPHILPYFITSERLN